MYTPTIQTIRHNAKLILKWVKSFVNGIWHKLIAKVCKWADPECRRLNVVNENSFAELAQVFPIHVLTPSFRLAPRCFSEIDDLNGPLTKWLTQA